MSSWLYSLPQSVTEGNIYQPGQPRTGIVSEGAYHANLPCLNPSCKNHGKPHPNCKCYGGYAKGGKVETFCSTNRLHKKDCQYYAEGGQVQWDDEASSPSSNLSDIQWDNPSQNPTDISQVVWDEPKDYSSGPQQALTAIEGAGKGMFGAVTPWAENAMQKYGNKLALTMKVAPDVSGLSYAEQAARQAANPGTSVISQIAGTIAGVFNPFGQAALLGKAGLAASEAAQLGAFGTKVLSGIVQGAGLSTSDEVTKAMLGQGDPTDAVGSALAHIGVGGLFGGMTGGAFHLAGKVVNSATQAVQQKLGDSFQEWAQGLAAGWKGLSENSDNTQILSPSFSKGLVFGQKTIDQITKRGFQGAGASAGGALFGPSGAVAGGYAGDMLNDAIGSVAKPFVNKTVGALGSAAILKTLAAGERVGLGQLNYADVVNKGSKALLDGAESVISGSGQSILSGAITDKNRQKLMDYNNSGGLYQELQNSQATLDVPQYAEGGLVTKPVETSATAPNGIEKTYPEHNLLLQQAKSRVFNYLNGLRPAINPPKLPYDEQPDQTEQTKTYSKACDIALDPLSILNHVKEGTLEPDHVQHLNSMYPEVAGQINKKLSERMIKGQLKQESPPPYKVRQGLSMLMGNPVDSSFTSSSVQAAQMTFVPPQQPQPPPVAKKPKPSALQDVVDDYRTSTDAAALRAQGDK